MTAGWAQEKAVTALEAATASVAVAWLKKSPFDDHPA